MGREIPLVPRPRILQERGGSTRHGMPRFTSDTGLLDSSEAQRIFEELYQGPAPRGELPVKLVEEAPAEEPRSPLFREEGYILDVGGGEARLYAPSRRGFIRGLAALAQLAAAGGRGDLLAVDYPAFRYRGVVEGFYFEPWSWGDRARMIGFMAWARMNTYIYAPKDDPYHREKWRLRYPDEIMGEIAGLARRASRLGVDLVFAVSPGLSAVYSSGEDEERLLEKYLSVAEHGVRSFGLFYDDIPEELLHEEDRERYGSLAEAHADFANRVYRRLLGELGEAELIVVPTEYRGVDMGPYFRELGEKLDPRVKLMWTGPKVCSDEITLDQARRVAGLSGGRLLVWDNYPVNDYARNRLNLGPLEGRDPRLPEALEGFLFNPMNEAWASRIPLATAADYSWNPAGYEPQASHRRALQLLYPSHARDIELLAYMLGYSTLWPRTPPGIDDTISAARSGVYGPAEQLLHALAALPDAVLEADERLYAEAEPYLNRLALAAAAGLEFLQAASQPGPAAAWLHAARGLELWRAARGAYHIAGALSRHREEVWYTFIERDFLGELLHVLAGKALAAVDEGIEAPWIFSNTDHLEGSDWSRGVDGDTATRYVSRRSYLPEGAEFLVEFRSKRLLAVELALQNPSAPGEPWPVKVEAGGECTPPCVAEADSVRIRAAAVTRGRRALQASLTPLAPRVYSDIPATTSAANIVDGRADTFLAVPPGSRGRSAVIDLGGKRRVEKVVVLQSPGYSVPLRVYAAAPGLVYPLLHLDAIEWVPVGAARGHYSVVEVGSETGYLKIEVQGNGGGRIHQVIVK